MIRKKLMEYGGNIGRRKYFIIGPYLNLFTSFFTNAYLFKGYRRCEYGGRIDFFSLLYKALSNNNDRLLNLDVNKWMTIANGEYY